MGDYVRQMPHHGSADLARRPSAFARFHIDLPLLVLLLILTGYGLFVLYSASGQSMGAVIRQGRYFAVAYVIMIVGAQFSLQRYTRWAPWLYLGGVAMLVGVMFFGVGAKGAQRWLQIGGFRFQPSEVMKLVVPMAVAWYLADRPLPPRFRDILVALVLVAIPFLLILQQPDLGTSLLIASSGLFVLFVAGIGWRYIFGAVVLALASAWPAWMFVLKDYQKQRILTLLNPESDKLGAGWNIIQSKTAIGSGGWTGKGWLEGTQSQLDFLPESHTDFIIAVLAEEHGLRGVAVLLAIYVLILLRGFWIGVNAQTSFGRMMAGSLTLTFFVYIFVNMGMVAGLLPVVGVPLPLVSAGGTSVVTLMAGFGILMAVSTERKLVTR
ncbi:rod shape-determining protein RodA [Halioglobus japonicus]|uniref:Peptidoglycan glycosyltransferase MrdB n=1 Tax=Halioglobus japonicus TaxID=930805 RepID=A0AAP8MDX2_9GAMM|nr:rod shape-determining protein RodA [Halioglobus japonicus]PLW86000.1 rod shape-determining protein RodA [Halioglobus japonicus]GHD15019.1 rod shape-determining protein RodA [Halioglobus japonicus]